ncbi:MAG: hypothetical protein OEP52_07690 [Acidimicrobiia bacterium]|nr:hypothetical protein [Acidimicrobiia bacterium]
MSTVALIGPDGAGKTTVAKRLLVDCPLPLRYLYMGMSIESSNVALPISRLAHRVKVAQHKRALKSTGQPVPSEIHLHGIEHRSDRRGRLAAVARLLRRVSEESYRQLVSWVYQWRGGVVLYDRHFLFDGLPRPSERTASYHRLTDRIHNWFLYWLYPRPDLVIVLDAPSEVLATRKHEVPAEYLEAERERLRAKLAYVGTWILVDATQPIDHVVAAVNRAIVEHHASETANG